MSAYQDSKTAAAHLGVSPSPALALLVLFLGVIGGAPLFGISPAHMHLWGFASGMISEPAQVVELMSLSDSVAESR